MKKIKFVFVIFLATLFFSSCLTVEKKEFTFKLTGKTSGQLTIKYINIISNKEDDKDVSEADFEELINDYYEGTSINEKFPKARNLKKRLFVENNQLCMEVTMNFDNLEDVRLYKYNRKSPIMFKPQVDSETEEYLTSNGKYGGDIMPIVFWDRKAKELHLTTTISEPDESSVSLVDQFREWKKDN